MATLTIQQAAQMACNAGFPSSAIPLWVAIMEGESSLDTTAVNSSDPHGGSFGVAQINGAHFGQKFGPQGQYTMNQQTAFNPQLAILYSYELSNGGTNFVPWGAFTNGRYQQFQGQVKQALTGFTCANSSPQQTNIGCQDVKAGSCQKCSGGIPGQCPTDQTCVVFNSDGSVYDAPLSPGLQNGECVTNAYRKAHLTAPTPFSLASALGLPDWLTNPDWNRVLKMAGGIILLAVALLGLFWPQAEQVISKVAEGAEMAAL